MAKRKIIVLELLENDGMVLFDHHLNKYVYFVSKWDEPYRSRVRKGDEFFIVNRTLDTPGLMMHGTIDSNVYHFYHPQSYYTSDRVDLTDYMVINPEKYRLLSTDYLKTMMPHFYCGLANPGREVPPPYVEKLRRIWKEYLEMNDNFDEEKK